MSSQPSNPDGAPGVNYDAKVVDGFGSEWQRFLRLLRFLFVAAQPCLEPIKIEINHRCGEQRQYLAERQSADHRIAERLSQLGTGTVADHQRDAA